MAASSHLPVSKTRALPPSRPVSKPFGVLPNHLRHSRDCAGRTRSLLHRTHHRETASATHRLLSKVSDPKSCSRQSPTSVDRSPYRQLLLLYFQTASTINRPCHTQHRESSNCSMKASRVLSWPRSGAIAYRRYRRASGSKDRSASRSLQTSRERGPHAHLRRSFRQAQLNQISFAFGCKTLANTLRLPGINVARRFC